MAAFVIMPFSIVSTQTVAVSIQAPLNGNSFNISLAYPAGNLPGTYNNNVFLWQTNIDPPNMVPWFSSYYATSTMTDGIPAAAVSDPGSGLIPGGAYVLGYSVGPALTAPPAGSTAFPNVCATVMIPSSWDASKCVTFQPQIGVGGLSTNLASFSFSLPLGIIPSTTGAWVGVWMNASPPYTPTNAPLGFSPVNAPNSTGHINVTLTPGLSPGAMYTAGLFTSGYSKVAKSLTTTALAATVTFMVLQP